MPAGRYGRFTSTTGTCADGRWSTRSRRPKASTTGASTLITIPCSPSGSRYGGPYISRAQANAEEHPGPGLQRAVRRPGRQPGPGADRVLYLDRSARRRTAGRGSGAGGTRRPDDRGGPQGQPGTAAPPCLPDAFVWLRLYQQEMLNLIPRGHLEVPGIVAHLISCDQQCVVPAVY